jgi:hypothetical protein
MSNQRSFKIEPFRFPVFVPKKIIFVFETKFWIETKRFLSVLENLGSKAFVLVRFFKFFLRQLKVFFVFKKPWPSLKRFGFVLLKFFKNRKFSFDS